MPKPAPQEPILYAKTGGPPVDWRFLEIFCDGVQVDRVLEANVNERWAKRIKVDAAGNILLEGEGDQRAVVEETICGTIEIKYNFEGRVAKSSQIRSVKYDITARVLSVVFRGTAQRYDYEDFPPEKWAELQAADSIGSYIYHNVTGPRGTQTPPYKFTKTAIPLETE